MRVSRRPWLIAPGSEPVFPDAELADADGLLAIGGDLSAQRLLAAYEAGIFPWYEQGVPPLWWSPDPRAILEPKLHISRSMRREIRRTTLSISFNQAFPDVMLACGAERAEGTWITREMLDAYQALHVMGAAHSIEVWDGDALVGGLYGVQRGALFAAESKFHRRTNASKLALYSCMTVMFRLGISLFDVQFLTDHLMSLGGIEIPRSEYLRRVRIAAEQSVDLSRLSEIDPLEELRHSLAPDPKGTRAKR